MLPSSALSTKYFCPARCRPFICTFFGLLLSRKASTTADISAGVIWKSFEVAQTLLPSELKMAALSTWPVPTRLVGGVLEVWW